MHIITAVTIKNFKNFKDETKFTLGDANYFIGPNNSGKTAVLQAIQLFFDDDKFSSEYINATKYKAKKGERNVVKIEIEFDTTYLKSKNLRQVQKKYGPKIVIGKEYKYLPSLYQPKIEYSINGGKIKELPEIVSKFISKVHVVYLHPQQGAELLQKAQDKLKERLLNNWGRGRAPNVTRKFQEIQKKWLEFRKEANSYLSQFLTDSVQSSWPHSETNIDLPTNVEDVIQISGISFKGNEDLPFISLTQQGTGAQQLILYYAHLLLDTDITQHRGEYFPIWLIEEPESFLHASLIYTFSKELNSEQWLEKLQIVASTHSPIFLANTRSDKNKIFWQILGSNDIDSCFTTDTISFEKIKEIGKLMGDSNFETYFLTSKKSIFLEDEKEITKKIFEDCGISITKGLNGIDEVVRYINVLIDSDLPVGECYFIVDGDRGLKKIEDILKKSIFKLEENKIKKYLIKENMFLIVLPSNVESLFTEFEPFLEDNINKLFTEGGKLIVTDNVNIPSYITGCHSELKKNVSESEKLTLGEKKDRIKNMKEIKDRFWIQVANDKIKFKSEYTQTLKKFLNIGN